MFWEACVKKLLQGMMLTCAAVATPVTAQTVTYACQYVEAAGLIWQNGRWVATEFYKQDPFILTAIDGQLVVPETTEENISHPLFLSQCNLPTEAPTGEPDENLLSRVQSCSDKIGNTLLFSFENLNGAYSKIVGAAAGRDNATKDSLTVAPFVCGTMR